MPGFVRFPYFAKIKAKYGMCWVLTDPEEPAKGYTHKLTPDQALYEIEPAINC